LHEQGDPLVLCFNAAIDIYQREYFEQDNGGGKQPNRGKGFQGNGLPVICKQEKVNPPESCCCTKNDNQYDRPSPFAVKKFAVKLLLKNKIHNSIVVLVSSQLNTGNHTGHLSPVVPVPFREYIKE
jgi:hypothetical protein